MKKIEITVEKTKTGFSAFARKYPVYTTGRNFEMLKRNMTEALNLYFEESGTVITASHLQIHLDLKEFFTFYKVINAKALSERIGMNQSLLAQYANGIKKPSSIQTRKILTGVQELGKELAAIQF
jgi:hypothetical protein